MINFFIIDNREDIEIDGLSNKYFLAQPSWESSIALFQCDYSENTQFPDNYERVDHYLHSLMYSARHFPPALAFAREKISDYCRERNDYSKNTFIKKYAEFLKYYLDNQKNYPFFMSQSKSEEVGWMMPGYYYWIVGFNELEDQVYWISDDYFIYQDAKQEFDVSYDDLVKLKDYPKKAFYNCNI